MMNGRAIVVEGVTKTYRMGVGRARVREMMPWPLDAAFSGIFPRWWSRDTFNALDGVSFSVPAGSSIGMVGHNGAGKTTALKVIAGVTAPTAGMVSVSGRIAALLDALVGFHPELTGRENIMLLGAMHGFGRRAMSSRIDRVFEFAEISDLADTPLKRYSAGMAARLGFATITALDVEILLVDEILAVGDASFQRKCIQWLDKYRSGGGTLLFVSHNLGLIRNMTEQVVWIDHGRVMTDGPTAEVLGKYAAAMERREESSAPMHKRRTVKKEMTARGLQRWGIGGARVEEVQVGQPNDAGLHIAIRYRREDLEEAAFCIGFVDEAGAEIGAAASGLVSLSEGDGELRCAIRPLPLRPGIYFPVVAIVSADGRIRDRWRLDRAVVVDSNGDAGYGASFGPVTLQGEWSQNASTR
jgi:lipopolysaccharide transport system ATP-binding protein